MTERWICWGSVCGECGVRHKTRAAAQTHCEKHGRDIKKYHGQHHYSDRQPHLEDCPACTPGSNYPCQCPVPEYVGER